MTVDEVLPPILLVDDNEYDIDLALRAFKKQQFANPIEVCHDGVEVMEIVKEWDEGRPPPVLILLDLKMPRINGLQVLAYLKGIEKYKEIPVVVLTTSSEDSDVNKAYALGANSYIVKPVEFSKFLQIASQIKLYWMALNSIPKGSK
jgi:CheY-like chemotaxis protein